MPISSYIHTALVCINWYLTEKDIAPALYVQKLVNQSSGNFAHETFGPIKNLSKYLQYNCKQLTDSFSLLFLVKNIFDLH